MMGGGGMMGFGGMGLLGGIIGLILNLAILIGIVVLIVWAVKRFTVGNSASVGQSPREIFRDAPGRLGSELGEHEALGLEVHRGASLSA